MKVSLSQLESVIARIELLYNKELLPELVNITEFDNPRLLIDSNYEKWLDVFSKKEELIIISYQLQLLIDRALQRNNLDELTLKQTQHRYFEQLLAKLLEYPDARDHNEILASLAKMSKESSTVQTSTSIFDAESKKMLNTQYQKIKLHIQQLSDQINQKRSRIRIEIPDEMHNTLVNEHLL